MIQSVQRAVALLEALDGQGPDGGALSDLAAHTGLKLPTAHNLLRTLVALGYAAHDADTRRYSLGTKAWELGRRQFLPGRLAETALPVLRQLQAELRETVLLALYRDGRRHTVASVESQRSLRVGGQTGVDDRLYGTATGRVLLSCLDNEALIDVVSRQGLPGSSWPEAASLADLQRCLARIRDTGFASCQRPEGHIRAAAVPVPLPEPDIHASLGMYHPTVRLPEGGAEKLRQLLNEAAAAIGAEFERRG